jgi:nucleotide-binding universal stress UspA family protein
MSIICGTDLSTLAGGGSTAKVLAVSRALAAQRGDPEVVLVHVVDDDGEAEAARARLDAQVAEAGAGVPIRAELVVGPVESTLLSFAETEGSDLIVIAATSSSGKLGSTAERVITHTRVPVLVVRDPSPWVEFARGTRPLRLLVGIDDSISSELGIQWTHALRARGTVEVVLGAVYYPDDAAEHYGLHAKTLVDRDPEIERLLARDLLRRFGEPDASAGRGVVARSRRGLGRIGDHVVELAREEKVDTIVVGTSQKMGLGRLGSVSSIVVHDAPQSVVCVPPSAVIPTAVAPILHSALVATDLSPFANRAVAYAFVAMPEGGEVHLAHVVEHDAEVDEDEVRRSLLALVPAGVTRTVAAYVVRGDDAATAIAQTAARLGCDLICIASHGRSGITRALVGSVADRLLRATRKPVLVLRPG